MPLYDCICTAGHKFERQIPLAKFEEPIECACGSLARRCISTPMFNVDQTDYSCPITGKHIGSRREHENNLRRHDCRVLEAGEKEAAAHFRAAEDAALDRKLEQTIEREFDQMPSDKKERLATELTRGKADLSVVRG